jgi:hypothetical protein
MRYHFAYIILTLGLTILACNKTRLGVNTYDIEYSKSATFDKDKKLIFVDLIGDSRCPTGVNCVWPGEATLALQAICVPADTTYFELTFGDGVSDHRDTTIFEIYKVEILEVIPYPVFGVELEKEDYSIRVLIEKS